MRAKSRLSLLPALLLAAQGVVAQDPLLVAPHAYKLVLENEWVKVVRVRYAPNEKLPVHDHTAAAAAYVYLNDGGPVIFKHDYGAATRPPTREGSFRVYKAVKETHEVENTSALPSEFLRVEFKTEPLESNRMNGRYHREAVPAGESLEKTQFENAQLRARRYVVAAGGTIDVATPSEPAVFVALTAGALRLRSAPDAPSAELAVQSGTVRWVPIGTSITLENAGTEAVEMLRFDLKTRPQPLSN